MSFVNERFRGLKQETRAVSKQGPRQGVPVVWCPAPTACSIWHNHPNGRTWALGDGNHLCLIALEGEEECAAGKCDGPDAVKRPC